MMLPHGNPPGVFPPTPIKKKSPIVWVLAGCGTILALGGVAGAVAVWWGYNKAKSYAEGALETGTGEMKTAAQLWPDVPPLEGMTPSQQTEMPLAIRVLARPFLDAMMKGLNNGKDAGHWDVAYYTIKGKTTRDVQAFYVPERMDKHGWQQQGGCVNVNEATFCSFQKQQAGKTTGLLIIAADDPQQKSTMLYFIRSEGAAASDAG
jgi:hypothetical protein